MPAHLTAAARTMNLFEALAREQRELSNAEVAKLLGMAQSSCYDLLHTLVEAGYLMRTARTRRFYPSARLATLAAAITAHNPSIAAGQEAIEMLRELTGETTLCGVLGERHVEVVGICEGRYELRYITAVGTRIGLHVTALGKALLAELEPGEAARRLGKKPLKAMTPASVADPAMLLRQLDDVRHRGHAEVDGEGVEGVGAMAVAGRIGTELLAVSLSGPAERLQRRRGAYVKALQQVKQRAFDRLRWQEIDIAGDWVSA